MLQMEPLNMDDLIGDNISRVLSTSIKIDMALDLIDTLEQLRRAADNYELRDWHPLVSDVVEIEIWCQGEGMIRTRRDCIIKDHSNGEDVVMRCINDDMFADQHRHKQFRLLIEVEFEKQENLKRVAHDVEVVVEMVVMEYHECLEGNIECCQAKVKGRGESFGSLMIFDGAFGGVGDEEVVVREGVVRLSSSFVRSTNSCFGV
ncbi:hypothetical protein Tco_1003911 [Tanacetum coccineum]|uniref:Uncharacterized protein n=1 Tax=Tanacetum coccineum TaxID=301880 RepID=A0ABQ5FBU4_9ASTR